MRYAANFQPKTCLFWIKTYKLVILHFTQDNSALLNCKFFNAMYSANNEQLYDLPSLS